MIFFIAFITVGILIGFYVIRVIMLKSSRKKNQKDKVWDDQLSSLLESLKKKNNDD